MNPNRGGEQPTPSFDVFPSTGAEQQSANAETTVEVPRTPESSPSRQQSAPVLPVIPPVASQSPVIAVPAVDDGQATKAGADQETSKMEKQWVEKAKSIISQTKDDPFLQKSEMSKAKAEYIQRRFNKKIRTDDAKA